MKIYFGWSPDAATLAAIGPDRGGRCWIRPAFRRQRLNSILMPNLRAYWGWQGAGMSDPALAPCGLPASEDGRD